MMDTCHSTRHIGKGGVHHEWGLRVHVCFWSLNPPATESGAAVVALSAVQPPQSH
jgi:hypothetical protein